MTSPFTRAVQLQDQIDQRDAQKLPDGPPRMTKRRCAVSRGGVVEVHDTLQEHVDHMHTLREADRDLGI